MNLFNRAVLIKENNAEAASAAWTALRKAGIPYRIKKEKSGPAKASVRIPVLGKTGNMGVDPHVNAFVSGGIPHSWTDGGLTDAIYTIYVLKKDLNRAKEICEIE